MKGILLSYIETAISWESSAWGLLLRVQLRKLQTNLRRRLNELTKSRVVDDAFKKTKSKNAEVFTCEKHFTGEDIDGCKYEGAFFFFVKTCLHAHINESLIR